jgi:hypothetical protein
VYIKKTFRRRNEKLRLAYPVIVLALVLGGLGFAGYRDIWSQKSGLSDIVATTSPSNQGCDDTDSKICKFQAGWKTPEYYSVSSRKTSGGVTSQTTYATDGKKYQLLNGNGAPGDVIVVDAVHYIKGSDGVWYKQTPDSSPLKDENPSANPAPGTGASVNASYRYLLTEPCQSLSCYKYEVVDTSSKDKQYIWFDTKDYQLRRTMTISPDGTVNDSTISYDKVVIQPPSDVQDNTLAPAAMPAPSADATSPSADQPGDAAPAQ